SDVAAALLDGGTATHGTRAHALEHRTSINRDALHKEALRSELEVVHRIGHSRGDEFANRRRSTLRQKAKLRISDVHIETTHETGDEPNLARGHLNFASVSNDFHMRLLLLGTSSWSSGDSLSSSRFSGHLLGFHVLLHLAAVAGKLAGRRELTELVPDH